jgi:parallel beta-helix repeat protein
VRRLALAVSVTAAWLVLALTPAQALANHVQCGDTITQDTTLDSDVINCHRDGIIIGADNITLDLNGHTIQGDGGGSYAGVYQRQPHTHITIENGSITDFGHSAIENGSVSGGGYGTYLLDASESVVRRVTAEGNGGAGIAFVGNVGGGDHNLIEKNRLLGNGVLGIVSQQSDETVISKNTVTGGRAGIDVFVSERNVVRHNSVSGASLAGITLDWDSHGTLIEKNHASENRDGILISLGPSGAGPRDVLVRHNVLNRNLNDGIELEPFLPADVLRDPLTLTSNIANQNGNLGIQAPIGVIDGGGNKASSNGNPLQCLNIECK